MKCYRQSSLNTITMRKVKEGIKDLTNTEKEIIAILIRGFKQIITSLEKLFNK